MDYLWELRRRQQAALNRLLTGSPSKEETTAEEEVFRRAAEGAEKAPAGQEKGISRPTAEQGKLIGQAESGEALPSAKRKAWDRAEADDRLLDGLTAQAEEFQQARRADALWRSETFSTGTLPGLLMAEGSRAAMGQRTSPGLFSGTHGGMTADLPCFKREEWHEIILHEL